MHPLQGMDGNYYHHYAKTDCMSYPPEHPGPFHLNPAPKNLAEMCIAPPELEQLQSPSPHWVLLLSMAFLRGMPAPNPPPISQHYMTRTREACNRCHGCPSSGNCPLLGVVPIETDVFTMDEPRLKDEFDDRGDMVGDERMKTWSVETSSVFSQRKRQCESRAVYNSTKVKRCRFELSFNRMARLNCFPKFVSIGNKDIANKKMTVAKQEVTAISDTLWTHYDVLLTSYMYYVSLGGVCGEPDGSSYMLSKDQYITFITDVVKGLSKDLEQNLVQIFFAVNIEEDNASKEGKANLDDYLCEQEWMECFVRIAAVLYQKEVNNGTVSRALQIFMMEVVHRLPKMALLDTDNYRKNRLYTEELDRVLWSVVNGFRILFKVYPMNNLELKSKSRREQTVVKELLWFSLTDWESLVSDAGLYQYVERDKVKLIFLQSRMLVTDELLDRTKNCCLMPVDFLEAVSRLADAVFSKELWAPKGGPAETFKEFCILLFEGLCNHWDGQLKVQMKESAEDGRTVLNLRTFVANLKSNTSNS
ncbi:unnamed protein product [Choristocarpus tenellus]